MTKLKAYVTTMALVLTATIGLAVFGSGQGNSDIALLQVSFDTPPGITYRVSPGPTVEEVPSGSPWVQPVRVEPGTIIVMMVTQFGTGETTCEITYRGETGLPKRMHGPGSITCRLVVAA